MNRQRVMFFLLLGAAVVIVALVLTIRALVPGANPTTTITLLYSTEKENWLKDVIPEFEASTARLGAKSIKVDMKKSGSREIYLSVLNGEETPDVISPASSLQITMLQDESRKKLGVSLVNSSDKTQCHPALSTPLVLVAWRERASALWGADSSGKAGATMWKTLHAATTDSRGWAAFGRPEWGYVKFSHTSPLQSNSGFQAILLMAYDYRGRTSNLTSADLLSNTGFRTWFLEMEGAISQFGNSTGDMMKEMVTYGPSRYDVLALYESVAIEQAENARNRYGDLRVFYPPATLVSDHPFCIVNANWVTAEKREAAQRLMAYLLAKSAQEKALLNHGFRPVNPEVNLDQPGSPFARYADLGLQEALPPEVETPSGDTLITLLDLWSRNVRR